VSPRQAARREAAWRRYSRGREDRSVRRTWVLVDEFRHGLVIVLAEFLSPENCLCY